MSIENIRAQIDEVDKQMAKLFVKRVSLVTELAALKQAAEKPILDGGREQEVIANVTSHCSKELEEEIAELYKEIMRLSRRYQSRLAEKHNG